MTLYRKLITEGKQRDEFLQFNKGLQDVKFSDLEQSVKERTVAYQKSIEAEQAAKQKQRFRVRFHPPAKPRALIPT